MVNNIKKIIEALEFDPDNYFYYLELVKRPKDDNVSDDYDPSKYGQIAYKIIKTKAELNDLLNKWVPLANLGNLRIYFFYFRYNIHTVAKNFKTLINENYEDIDLINIATGYLTGRYHQDKLLLLDFDEDELNLTNKVNDILSNNNDHAILKINSVNGEHWIVSENSGKKILERFPSLGYHPELKLLMYYGGK